MEREKELLPVDDEFYGLINKLGNWEVSISISLTMLFFFSTMRHLKLQ